MSLARAFTTRRAKLSSSEGGFFPQRSNSTAKGLSHSASIRNKISSPMELTHTTNMLAYNAPDLYPREGSSRSSKSDDDLSFDSPSTARSSPPSSPDIPSAEPLADSPEPNHLSCYFTAPTQKPAPSSQTAPTIPQRAPSHTKKASFESLANRQARLSNQSNKTVSTKASFSVSRSNSTSTTATSVSSASRSQKLSISAPISSPITPESQHPFGHELAKVSELAEELGVKDKLQVVDEEEDHLATKGLFKFQAQDYLNEIDDLLSSFMKPEPMAHQQAVWI
ncbi:hypothetical protein F4808DRAFT_462154 [Astrocystis sublimbata]|nr:hypothetical protein F4808DRAFT_462154 [Astrocystis sublimbata]